MHLEGYKSKAAPGELGGGSPQKMLSQCPWRGGIAAQSGSCEAGGMGTLFWGQQSYPGGCAPL